MSADERIVRNAGKLGMPNGPRDPEPLAKMVKAAQERYDALSPIERAIHDLEQRRSWVTAELRMNDDASPNGRTKEQADAILRRVAPEYVLLDAYREAQSSLAAAHARIGALQAALRLCASKFREYERIHAAKGTLDGDSKARMNGAMAELCERSLKGRSSLSE